MMRAYYWLPNSSDTNGWKGRHREAIANSYRNPVAAGPLAWCRYADAHLARFESSIGEDYVLGPAWAAWGRALLDLLNGETGGLDCGTVDAIIRHNLEEQGFPLD